MTQEQRIIALAQAIGLDIKSLNTTINQLVGNSMVATRINRNTNQSIPTGAGWTDLVWNVSNYESNGDFWSSGATVTIPENGLYFITAEASFDGTGLIAIATINMQIEVVVSGTPIVIGDDEKQLQVNTKGSLFVFAQRYFNAGDTIKAQVKHSDAGSLTVLTQGTHSPDIIVTKLNGAKGEPGGTVITSGTAIPSGGNNGDVYLQYI